MRPVCVFVLATTLACPAVATAADAPADSARGMFEGAGDSHRRYTVEHLWERRRSIRDLEEAARLAPRDAHTLDRLGEAEFDGGFYHAARLAFQRALAVEPGDADAAFGLGRTCEREWLDSPTPELLDEALAHFEAAVRARPGFYEAWVALAAARFERRDAWAANDAAMAALALAPQRPEGVLAAAYLAYRTGAVERADSLFAVAVARCPAGIAARFADVTPLLSESQQATFDELGAGARTDYVRGFWSRADPDPTTPQNEARLEYWSRLAHALLLICDPWSPHWLARTDLYARYGHAVQIQPDDGRHATRHEMPEVVWGATGDEPKAEALAGLHQEVLGGGAAIFAPLPPMAHARELATLVSRFEGPNGARLAVRLETPGSPVDSVIADCVVLGPADRVLARGTRVLGASGCDPAAMRAGEFTFDLPTGPYRLAVAVHDEAGGRGVTRIEGELPPTGTGLALSDVVLACGATDAADRQGSVRVSPNVRARIAGERDVYAYFEVYHLHEAAGGGSRFEYEYTVDELGRRKPGRAARADRDKPPPALSFRSLQEGVGPLRRQFIDVPTGALPPGRYRLTIAVRDELAGTRTELSTEFEKVAASP